MNIFIPIERQIIISKKVPWRKSSASYQALIGENILLINLVVNLLFLQQQHKHAVMQFSNPFILVFYTNIFLPKIMSRKIAPSHMKIIMEPSPSMKFTVSYCKLTNLSDHGAVGVKPRSHTSVNGK